MEQTHEQIERLVRGSRSKQNSNSPSSDECASRYARKKIFYFIIDNYSVEGAQSEPPSGLERQHGGIGVNAERDVHSMSSFATDFITNTALISQTGKSSWSQSIS